MSDHPPHAAPEKIAETRRRFETMPPSPNAGDDMADIRRAAADLAEYIEEIVPDGREKSLALTNLEQAKFWANQGILVVDNKKEYPL